MRQDKSGSGGIIINIASTLGYLPYQGFPIYVATKHAVLGFLKSLIEPKLCELTGLQFITICPGYTNTRLIGSSILHELALEAQGEPFPPQRYVKKIWSYMVLCHIIFLFYILVLQL